MVNESIGQFTKEPHAQVRRYPKVSESHTAMVCQSKNSGLLSNAEALAKLPQQSLIKWSKFRDPGWTLRIRTGRNLGRLGLRENALLMTCLPYNAPRGLQLWCLLSSVKYLTCGSITVGPLRAFGQLAIYNMLQPLAATFQDHPHPKLPRP